MKLAYVTHEFPSRSQPFTWDEVRLLARHVDSIHVMRVRADAQVQEQELAALPANVSIDTVPAWWSGHTLLRFLQLACCNPGLVCAVVWGSVLRRYGAGWHRSLQAVAALLRGAWLAHWASVTDAQWLHAQLAREACTAAWIAACVNTRPFSFRSHTGHDVALLKEKLQHAQVIFSISEFDRGQLLRSGADPMRVVINRLGVCSSEVPHDEDERKQWDVLAVGRLVEKKGFHVLLQALANLRPLSVNAAIVGSGPEEQRLRGLVAQYGLGHQVAFLGALPRQHVLTHMRSAKVLAMPSVQTAAGDMDGIPVVVLEAMASGCVVVSTRLSGIPEAVRERDQHPTGFLVEAGNARALSQVLRQVLTATTRESLAAMKKNARRQIEEHFDLECNVPLMAAFPPFPTTCTDPAPNAPTEMRRPDGRAGCGCLAVTRHRGPAVRRRRWLLVPGNEKPGRHRVTSAFLGGGALAGGHAEGQPASRREHLSAAALIARRPAPRCRESVRLDAPPRRR